MKILLVSATYAEIRPLAEKAGAKPEHDEFLLSCSFGSKDIDILVTGVGIASTAYRMGKLLAGHNYDFAINTGIAGVFHNKHEIGEVVNVSSDIIAELGAENGSEFLGFNELNMGKNILAKTVWKTENIYEICNPVIQKLKRTKGITVNTVHGNKENICRIIHLFNPDVETMEGAAFLHICNEEKINCAQIRSISNYVEQRNTANWNIELAIKTLNQTVMKIINTL